MPWKCAHILRGLYIALAATLFVAGARAQDANLVVGGRVSVPLDGVKLPNLNSLTFNFGAGYAERDALNLDSVFKNLDMFKLGGVTLQFGDEKAIYASFLNNSISACVSLSGKQETSANCLKEEKPSSLSLELNSVTHPELCTVGKDGQMGCSEVRGAPQSPQELSPLPPEPRSSTLPVPPSKRR
jgi:hypothetical protein